MVNEHLFIPPRFKEGDTIGIISPSAPVTADVYEKFYHGIETLKEYGLKVKLGKHVLDRHYYMAGSKTERLQDFHTVWMDPEVRMILMSQGGSVANHLLNGINYDMVENDPKIFAGMSDGTTLLNAVYAKTGLITYHGPDLIWTFGQKISAPIKTNIIKTFFEGNVGQLSPNPVWKHDLDPSIEYQGWQCIRPGNATGKLVGGNLSIILRNLLATHYCPDFENTILFLEATNEIGAVDSMFTTLKLNGVFDKIKGIILGWFKSNEARASDIYRPIGDILLECTEEYAFPILEIGELGHYVENYVFPIGAKITLESQKKILSIDSRTVKQLAKNCFSPITKRNYTSFFYC